MLDTLKALADPTRLRIFALLTHGEFTVQELTAMLGMGQSRISRHLKIMADAGVVSVKRQGTWGYYRLGDRNRFFRDFRSALEDHLQEIPERRADLEALARVLENRRSRNREFFEAHARQWDRLADEVLPTAPYREKLVETLPPCECLLEVGVGTGALLPDLLLKAKRLVGVDHSPAMLQQARERVVSERLEGVELRLGDMLHLPVLDGEMEGVLLNMVFHHADQPGRVLAELGRVVAPGGFLVIADYLRHEREWAREHMADQWLGFEREELLSWLAAAGFSLDDFGQVTGRNDELDVFILTARRGQPSTT